MCRKNKGKMGGKGWKRRKGWFKYQISNFCEIMGVVGLK
jgi:hypothetical protein